MLEVIQKQIQREYQPINEYGIIGDCHSALLAAPDGSIDWGCLPDFDSPAIFCRLLDEEQGGYFQIAPSNQAIPGMQRYIAGTNVLQTRFSSIAGELTLTDFMPVESLAAWPYEEKKRRQWLEAGTCYSLVRMVECTHGQMEVSLRLKATPDYARSPITQVKLLTGERGAVLSSEHQHLGLSIVGAYTIPSFHLWIENEDEHFPVLCANFTLREGDRFTLALGLGQTEQAVRRLVEEELPTHNFAAELTHTLYCWRDWISQSRYSGPYGEWVERSALLLKLVTYAPTGGLVAAPTTSLPELLGGGRNWDYRYTWLRDSTFTLYALSSLGYHDEMHAFLHWLQRLDYSAGEDILVMYTIHGDKKLPEEELTHLSGYRDSRPVRVGNGAVDQLQLDIYGEALDCFHLFRVHGGFTRAGIEIEGPLWNLMSTLVEHVCTRWRDPDNGIWEVRGGVRHFVYSKVMCWVALDRGIRAAEELGLEADIVRWRHVREDIRTDILTHGYNTEIGAFTQSYAETALDASCLLMPLVGFIAPDDPRMKSTVDRIMEHLTDDNGFLYRYLSDDGLHGNEGTFAICTFWLVDNLSMQGRLDEARSLFERVLPYASKHKLFSEEIDSHHHLALGNYPQAFTHLALINSAGNLSLAEKRLVAQAQQIEPVVAAIHLQEPVSE